MMGKNIPLSLGLLASRHTVWSARPPSGRTVDNGKTLRHEGPL